jgi:hypothetical protein
MKLADLPYLIQDMKNEMPRHNEYKITIPYTYKPLPKSLSEESHKVNNKYLNNHLGEIEEAQYTGLLSNNFIKSFLHQQVTIHGKSGVLNHDNFFKQFPTEYHSPLDMFSPAMIGISSVAPASYSPDMKTNVGATGASRFGLTTIVASRTDSDPVIGDLIDRVAENYTTAAGNFRMGVYEGNSATVPDNLLTELGSTAVATGYGWNNVTEAEFTKTYCFLADMTDENTTHLVRYTNGSGIGRTRYMDTAYTYGALSDPFSVDVIDTSSPEMKVGHSLA